jgi:branched-chain amino acid transport system ATP-binding protein
MILLETQEVDKNFGGIHAVDHISISVHKGEIVGMIGPNGSGKTTFINLLSGIYRCDSGKVFFKGENITGIHPYHVIVKGIVRTFQNLRIFRNMSVLENVMVGRHSMIENSLFNIYFTPRTSSEREKLAHKKAMEVLQLVNLAEKKDELARNLPYGRQKILEIARALVSEPALILLDEPTAGMNPKEVTDLCLFLEELRNKGYTLFIIEHNMRAIMSLSDRIAVLNVGQKIKEGTPEEIQKDKHVQELYLGKEET